MFVLLAAGVATSLFPGVAGACACCAERGHRRVTTAPPDAYERELLGALRFGPVAELYVDAGGLEAVRGFRPSTDAYDLKVASHGEGWHFAFAAPGGREKGSLALPLRGPLRRHEADFLRDQPAGGTGPGIHKEWTLESLVQAEGVFAPAAAGATGTLAFLGQGNVCAEAGDFHAWSLDVRGADAVFRFFGRLAH